MGQRAEQIFHEAREQPAGETRDAYLADVCGLDDALRLEVEALLKADAEAGAFLSSAVLGGAVPDAIDRLLGTARLEATSEQPGDLIDHYRLLTRIGEGGFGSVWLAEQRAPVKRRVALKIVKLGMDTRRVIARFETERQALAVMEHPNIARVLDAGSTSTGRPYFVMEYIEGVPILEYCDRDRLDTPARLRLFTSVCHAIQHAHQKGVIHRDIKPSNVLIAEHDGTPMPKVIDFGIAKATGTEPAGRTGFTEHGQMIGTPAYMSPEQAGTSRLDVDTRSDIYSLGVLLYELLTGTTPFEQPQGLAEMIRVVREDEPPTPSTRLAKLERLPELAALRRTEPVRLTRAIRGDLDWIVMKCLEKDRARRYDTAAGLAFDIQRHLVAEPVLAAPPSRAYRLRKLLHRYRGTVIAAALIVSTLVAGMIGTLWQSALATDERNRALAAQQVALKVKNLLERVLTTSNAMHDTLRGGALQASVRPDVTLIEVLDRNVPLLASAFGDEAEVEADVRYALGKCYFGISRFTESSAQLERALALYRDLFGDDDRRTLDCQYLLGFDYWWSGSPDRADSAFRAAVAGHERRGDESAAALSDAKEGLALFLYNDGGAPHEAVGLAREALGMRRLSAPEPSRDVFMAKTTLAHVLQSDEATLAEADLLATEALAQCVAAPSSRATADEWFCLVQASDCARALGRLVEAEAQCRRLVEIGDGVAGPVSFMGTIGRTRLAHCLREQGRWSEAEAVFRESLADELLVFGPDNGHTMDTKHGLAQALFEQWRLEPERSMRLAEAESLALEVAEWVVAHPNFRGAGDVDLLIRIYEARDAAEPGRGHDARAAEWRARRPEIPTPSSQ